MKLIRALVFPWFAFYLIAIGGVIAVGLRFPKYWQLIQFDTLDPRPLYAIAGAGAILALALNLRTLGNVGIWLSESLPDSLRYGTGKWLSRAFKCALIAGAFWALGKFQFMPLIWHAAVIPIVFTICLFTAIFSLIGPILKWSANLAFSRTFSVILSLPVYALVPVTAIFIGHTYVRAYQASEPELALALAAQLEQSEPHVLVDFKGRILSISDHVLRIYGEWPKGSGKKKTLEIDLKALTPAQLKLVPRTIQDKEVSLTFDPAHMKLAEDQRNPEVLNDEDLQQRLKSTRADRKASALREIYEAPGSCASYSKEILAALDAKAQKEVAYWAIRLIECADFKSVVVLPKLAHLMAEHRDPEIRAAAVKSLKNFNNENVRQISYLLAKRLTTAETPQVIEAAAGILAPLGGEEVRWSTNRLKGLLDDKDTGSIAARVLIEDYRRDDLVATHVGVVLARGSEIQIRNAIPIICQLPEARRTVAEPHIQKIVALIKTAEQSDPAIKALNCLGTVGFKAIREEMNRPTSLAKPIAARAFAELNIKGLKEALEIAENCSKDNDTEVRRWCSQGLGRIGSPALPKILELLTSKDDKMKESGKTALEFFDDPAARDELRRIREENSGWMANNAKLQIAQAVGTALVKIEKEKAAKEELKAN